VATTRSTISSPATLSATMKLASGGFTWLRRDVDALRRVVNASTVVGCTGIVVDAKDEGAVRFYAKYDFVAVTDHGWPRRMFLPMGTARAAFAP